MAVTALKASFSKAPLREMLHRDFKNFEQDKFKHELKNIIRNESVEFCCEFEKVFLDILNKWARPFKKNFLRAIYDPCMTKRLKKAITKRSELKSVYLKIQIQDSIKAYKKH